ncbi:MAG: hypothetical protein A3F83_02080 [Candidatus Glassbacteria bacterium RIFCSPLOWO2_12_FULL_58_11]|uniref:LPS export ABC transporter permease LptG n=1 Tax=Candidatus Glassbacteria bacterium RIFCSPLOWO2_12_FULL_58_11 TaxID=1817867 RepID=A0A1F5YKF3_9BACT|nr:MAG: hypothetical protein A3F83_02080 [Candidatus Glassbacteria bacterium RIFCSPLOWO2_12_FULL_58_11]
MISRTLYRYIVREYLKIFIAALGGFLFICLVGDAAEHLNDFVDAQASSSLILMFYVYQVPFYIIFILPAASLIATLFTLGQMSRHNELTAMLSSGISLGRIFLPLLLLLLLVSAGSFAVNETVVPIANERKKDIRDYQMKKRARPLREVRQGIDYQGEQGRRWVADLFDLNRTAFKEVKLLDFSGPPESPRIEYRIDAHSAVFEAPGTWRFIDGTIRYFPSGSREEWVVKFVSLALAGFRERPEDFVIETREAQQMSYLELKKDIGRKMRNGINVAPDETELWIKTSLPLANFIIVLFGAPLVVLRRGMGPGIGIALGIVVYMLFMGSYYVTRSMGYEGVVPAWSAAWLSNIVFAVSGIILFLKARR